MPDDSVTQTTLLLRRISAGDAAAADELLPLVYTELKRMAGKLMARQSPDHTLQTTALVHEAWLKLAGPDHGDWESRRHFVRVAATAMRSVLVDHARARHAQKRGQGRRAVPLEDGMALVEQDSDLLLAIDEALERLAPLDEKLARIAELRCFLGLSNEEVAEVMGISRRSVERGWRTARAWLQRELEGDAGPGR